MFHRHPACDDRGFALKQQGSNWTGFCPFHDDKETPNLIVTPGKGLFRCMAACCGATGNAIQFVEKFDGLSFRHAFEVLAGRSDAAFAAGNGVPRKQSTVPRLPCPLEDTSEDAKLLEQVADYYAKRLLAPENQAARDYLAARGLDDPDLWHRHQIGFSDRTLGLRIPEKNRKQGAGIRARLETLGVYRKTGREHLNGCITIPVRSASGDIVQLYGRRIDPKAPKEMRHLYLEEVRPRLLLDASQRALFLTSYGEPFNPDVLSRMVSKWIKQADIGRPGSCHLIRSTCATHMLEGGADIRFIQQLLGHEKLETTAIYTQVSIEQLKAVHSKTHPAETGKKPPQPAPLPETPVPPADAAPPES